MIPVQTGKITSHEDDVTFIYNLLLYSCQRQYCPLFIEPWNRIID